MSRLLLFNKPFQVLSQFTDPSGRATLADYVPVKDVYPVGRLDYDSEGLMLLTDSGAWQHALAHPKNKVNKHYWVQVEGDPDDAQLQALRNGVELKDGPASAVSVRLLDKEPPGLWPRTPPVRFRKSVPDRWLELVINEGRNRQVRRMTAAVGLPTLRLIRHRIGDYSLGNLQPGQWHGRDLPPKPPGHRPKPKRTGRKPPRRTEKKRRAETREAGQPRRARNNSE